MNMAVHILGIRHHGPGSARNVAAYLEQVQPDIVLVEGPPEADDLLHWVGHAELKPPVAILCYQPDDPQQSVFYPFAEFSPEWQAIAYARKKNIHVRFMDLPIANQIAVEQNETQAIPPAPIEAETVGADDIEQLKTDPIGFLADAAGFDDGEKWWEHSFEHRLDNEDIFEAVAEAMASLREKLPSREKSVEKLREAHMRKMIRQAEKEMFHTIAVICGAWHVPVLMKMPPQKEDNELLKGLPKVKIECTWIPWTYHRLGFFSGYGAGIHSPGWYHHVWNHPLDDGTLWMAKVAQLFRQKQMDTSVAHVIEAVRLGESLASLRNLPKAGLEELNEATLSVLCNGESILLQLIQDELIVSNRIGDVPANIPKPPLQVDIEKQQKTLRLPPTADFKDYTLDLRKEGDLERSVFLHRLRLLGIKWGQQQYVSGKGTFKEQWRLQWDPGFSIEIIERGNLGNTVLSASANSVMQQAGADSDLKKISELLEQSIPAGLPEAIAMLINRINNLAAASADVVQLMEVIPGLVGVSRYGNVRKTDAVLVMGIVTSMITRICVSLPNACVAIDEDAAKNLLELFFKLNDAVNLLQQAEMSEQWQQTLGLIAQNKNTAPVIAGYSTRLLLDYKLLEGDELVIAFSFAMSQANEPATAAAWLEGFLKGSGTLLLIDINLWNVVNNWVADLDETVFMEVLPLLRRTFANFSQPERRKIGEKVKNGGSGLVVTNAIQAGFDPVRANMGVPVILQLLGLDQGQSG